MIGYLYLIREQTYHVSLELQEPPQDAFKRIVFWWTTSSFGCGSCQLQYVPPVRTLLVFCGNAAPTDNSRKNMFVLCAVV